MFLRKGILKICSRFTGERPCQSVITVKLQSNRKGWLSRTPRVFPGILRVIERGVRYTAQKKKLSIKDFSSKCEETAI